MLKMDSAEDVSYLTLLHDGTNNYLLQSNDESLGIQEETLNTEALYTAIDDGTGTWPVGLPILMNSTLMSEGDPVESTIGETNDLSELYQNQLENEDEVVPASSTENTQISYPVQMPGNGYLTSDGLLLTSDLLLQLKLNLENNIIDNNKLKLNTSNKKTLSKVCNRLASNSSEILNAESVTIDNDHNVNNSNVPELPLNKAQCLSETENNIFSASSNLNMANECISNLDIATLNTSNNVIRLLDDININSNQNEQVLSNSIIDNIKLFDTITAYKCKQCRYLCENENDMLSHWKCTHLLQQNNLVQESITKKDSSKTDNKGLTILYSNKEIQMKSILKNTAHQTVYVCSECRLGFPSTDKLKNHMIVKHKLVQNNVEVKELVQNKAATENKLNLKPTLTKQKSVLALLQKQAKASRKIKCSVKGCDLRFSMDDMRLRHEKCHVEGQKKQFVCFECNTKFSLWRVCSMHMWNCHKVDLGLYSCQMCSVFKASSPVRLASHMAIHKDDKPYACLHCDKTFKQHSQLQNHQITHKKPGEIPEWASQKQCNICKKYFASFKSLKKHIKDVHDKFKPFICSVCGHKTTRKAMLELHLRQHTGEKPHKCNLCPYRTGDHNSLRRHSMRHSGEIKYSCPHCSYQSIQSTSYKNHIASKHPGLGGSYFCTLCSYHTVNENAYTNHLGDHKNGLIKEISDGSTNRPEKMTSAIQGKPNFTNNNCNVTEQLKELEDDETQAYLMLLDHSNEAVDTGGITIPAGFEIPP